MQAACSELRFDGKSFLPILNGNEQEGDRFMYFELGYARAVRKGNFKHLAVRYPAAIETMMPEERKKLLDEWNAERHRKRLRIVTEDPTQPFSHLTAIPGDAERGSTGSCPGYFDRDQLYDLSNRPQRTGQLASNPEYAAILADLKAELEKMVKKLPGTFGEFGHQNPKRYLPRFQPVETGRSGPSIRMRNRVMDFDVFERYKCRLSAELKRCLVASPA